MDKIEQAKWQAYIKQRVKVDPVTGCWNWQLSLSTGYGQSNAARYAGRSQCAHRLSYCAFTEDVPDGVFLRHQCHNRRCCNPAHMLPGSKQDNFDDNKRDGIRHTNARLTVAQVAEIKQLLLEGKHTQKQLGEKFNVSRITVGDIARGKNWADIKPATPV